MVSQQSGRLLVLPSACPVLGACLAGAAAGSFWLTDSPGMTQCGYMPVPGTDFDVAENPPASEGNLLLAGADRAGITQYGFDYAWQSDTPAQLAALLAANGTQFACRYLSDAVSGGKGLMLAEVRALLAAGIIICPNWEVSGTDFTGGYAAGLADGQAAAAALSALGAPAGTYVWFSIDTDTSDFTGTDNYLLGAKAGTGAYIAQLYGSYAVVEAAASAGLGSFHWQTYAWSAGNVSQHAGLYQYQNSVTVGGISMDRDRTLQALSGPWATFGAVPAPLNPTISAGDTGAAVSTAQTRLNVWGAALTVDGSFGAATTAAVKAFQGGHSLTVDGTVGPLTWVALDKAPAPPPLAAGQLPAPSWLAVDRDRLALTWAPVTGAAGYTTCAYGVDGKTYATEVSSSSWCVLNGLTPGWTYTIRTWANGGKVAPLAAQFTITMPT